MNFNMGNEEFIDHQKRYKDLFGIYLPTEKEYRKSTTYYKSEPVVELIQKSEDIFQFEYMSIVENMISKNILPANQLDN